MIKKHMTACIGAAIAILAMTGCSANTKGGSVSDTETEIINAKLDYDVDDYVKLGEYKGLEAGYLVPSVTPDDMQIQIQDLLDENTQNNAITDRSAMEGDSVNIDYTGKVDGVEFEGGSDTNFDLVLGSGNFLEDFEKGLVGAAAGASVTIPVTFPEDYDEDLAGKQAEFTVKVNSISEVIVPEYNDALVAQVTEYKTTQEYEEAMQAELMESATQESESIAGEEALQKAVENAVLDGYPSELYDTCYQETLDSYQSYADMFGMELKDFLQEYMEMDEAGIKDAAVSWVNDILVSQAIAEKEGFAVTEDNYKEEAQALSVEYGYESLADFEKDYSRISVESNIVREKVIAFLYENAKLVEKSEDEYYEEVSTE